MIPRITKTMILIEIPSPPMEAWGQQPEEEPSHSPKSSVFPPSEGDVPRIGSHNELASPDDGADRTAIAAYANVPTILSQYLIIFHHF